MNVDAMSSNNALPVFVEGKSILECLPSEIALKVLNKCYEKDWVLCTEATRELRRLASDDALWKPVAEALGLKVEASFYDDDPAILSEYKAAVGPRVLQLKEATIAAEPIVTKEVRSGLDFSMALMRGEDREAITAEENQKEEWGEILKKGVDAHFYLRKIGMSNLTKIEQFATVLEQRYSGYKGPWLRLACQYVSEENFEQAVSVVDAHFHSVAEVADRFQRTGVLSKIILKLNAEGKFAAALEYLRKMTPYDDRGESYVQESIESILDAAYERDDLELIKSMMLQGLIPDMYMPDEVGGLIRRYIEKREFGPADALLNQYEALLRLETSHAAHSLVEIYVHLGHHQKAWQFALEQQDSDFAILYTLQRGFSLISRNEEAEKVQKHIHDSMMLSEQPPS